MTEHDSLDWYASHLEQIRGKDNATEADVSGALVRPVLEKVLGFGVSEIDAEAADFDMRKRLRPDYICGDPNARVAKVIVEVKRLGVNLEQRSGRLGWSTSPAGQLHRYLNKHARSGPGTWGVLTNGIEWLVVRREGDACRTEDFANIQSAVSLDQIDALLKPIIESKAPERKPVVTETPTVDWLEAVASCKSPSNFIDRVAPHLNTTTTTNGVFAKVGEYTPDGELLPLPAHIACLELNLPDGYLAPQDIAEELHQTDFYGRVVGVAYTRNPDGHRLVRGFHFDENKVLATALVEPDLPGSRALNQFAALSLHATEPPTKAIAEALSSDPLHRQFHEDIEAWFSAGSQDLDAEQLGNRLRHLIRVMFTWLLQVRGVIPDDALWLPTRQPQRHHAVHGHVLWLFSDVLATPKDARAKPSGEWERDLVESVPFLNGSLFSKLSHSEQPAPITNEDYLGDDGLFPLLRRYDWTLSDRTGYGSETAIDPSMLGEMFERLMLAVEGPREEADGRLKMPLGSYYTPQDIADEMTSDAIGKRLTQGIPDLDWQEARALAHSTPHTEAWKDWSAQFKRKAVELLRETTAFDPCCGSGAFTMSMLYGLWRAKGRLSGKRRSTGDLEDIIERQLYAVDIHPTAVLITRLRIFIALVDAKRTGAAEPRPLPNLETRCMVANTLCVKPGGQSALGGSEWDAAIDDLRAAREMWTSAHLTHEKEYALAQEETYRKNLRDIASDWSAPGELKWLDVDFLSASAPAVESDVRQLFPAPRGGWDIVIGNPPYQKPDKSDVARAKRFGYTATSINLYLMFIEAALTVCKDNGCVTLVVPHSIVFRRNGPFPKTRQLIERAAQSVDIRTYDNMPQPLFPKLPWLKQAKHGIQNRQRCTVLIISKKVKRKPPSAFTVTSRGLIRFRASDRSVVLRKSDNGAPQPTMHTQWSQAPTEELGRLLSVMWGAPQLQRNSLTRSRVVTFPPTGMYFLSCLPEGVLDNPSRKQYALPDDEFFWPWLGLYNSHLFHAYWLMIGDAFHVTATEYGTVRPPPGWQDDGLRTRTERTARRLMHKRTLDECHTVKKNRGEQHNINFHKGSAGPIIVEQLDQLLLEAYRLPKEPLMRQMRTIRTSSAHRL